MFGGVASVLEQGLDEALVAGVSTFGFAGTIAHALVVQVELARAAPTLESDAALSLVCCATVGHS